MSAWNYDHIPDQTGRSAIVTGANSGIGFETARALVRKGAHVTLACRSVERGQAAVDRILAEAPDGQAVVEQLDLAMSRFSRSATRGAGANQADRATSLLTASPSSIWILKC